MNKTQTRKLRFEGLEDRRLAAGINLQYTNLVSLQQQTGTSQWTSLQGSTTYGSSKTSNTLAPGISVNHNETFIAPRRRRV